MAAKKRKKARKTPRKVPKKRRIKRAGKDCVRVCKQGYELVRRHPLTGKAYKGRAFMCARVSYKGDRALTRTVKPKLLCPGKKALKRAGKGVDPGWASKAWIGR